MAFRLLAILLLSGAIIMIEGNAVPHEVKGIVGRSALLSVSVPHNLHVVEVRWMFGSRKDRLGNLKDKRFEPFNLSLTSYSQLMERLDAYSETTLRIRNLTKGDSGVYRAIIELSDGSSDEEEFQLNVYDPVPDPHITEDLVCPTEGGCNITLHCHVANKSGLNFTWHTRDPNGTRLDHIADGHMLNVSINSSMPRLEYQCVVSNPVEQKNATISPACQKETQQNTRTHAFLAIAFVAVAVIVLIMGIAFLCKPSQRNHNGFPSDDQPGARSKEAENMNGVSDALNGPNRVQRPSDNGTETSQEEAV